MVIFRGIVLGLLLASSALLIPIRAEAGLCGFPGAVSAGANTAGGPGANQGYVVLFDVATLTQNGIASVNLGPDYGKACMDIFRDVTLGAAPTNFLAVFAQSPQFGNPPECAQQGCSILPPATVIQCRQLTLCLAFP
jgi:hypothetical protein